MGVLHGLLLFPGSFLHSEYAQTGHGKTTWRANRLGGLHIRSQKR